MDPFDWTVDEVVAFLCHNPSTPWSQSANPSQRPDPVSFEAALRENLINGEVLLNDVDKEILREDLGLRALGHRSTVLTAIRYLRQLSVKYQRANSAQNNVYDDPQHIKSPIYSPLVPSGHGPGWPLQRSSFSFSGPVVPSLLRAPPLALPAVSTTQDPETEVGHGERMPDESPTMQVMNELVGAQRQDDTRKSDHPSERPVPDDELMVSSNNLPHLRSHERYVVDYQGKKRRKLELPSDPAVTTQLVLHKGGGNHTGAAMGSRQWYMGPDKITAAGLFYPEVEGQDDERGSFLIVSPKFPTAQRLFVKGCLHHFYQQRPVDLGQDKECRRSAIFPFRKSSLKNGQPEIFTLYTLRNGKVSVTKEDTAHWSQFNHQGETDLLKNPQNRDPYDYLVDKYPVKDSDEDAYPLYGESGSEGEYDQDTWREMEENHGTPQEKSKYLTIEEVDSIMASYIKNCEERWQTAHLPKESRKARRLWLMAKKNKTRNLQIKVLVRDVEHLGKRLKKIQQAIREQEDTKIADLEVQCQSMEQTIFNIEAQRWRISVLEQEKCPPKMPFTPRRRQVKPKRQADEESLHSESSDYSNDSLRSFIDDDLEDNRTSLTHPSSPDARQYLISDQTDTSSESDSEVPISLRRRKGNPPMGLAHSPNKDPNDAIANNSESVPLSSPSPYMRIGDLTVEYIDLTRSSSESPVDDFAIRTPPLNPVRPKDIGAITPLKIEQPPSPHSPITPHRTLGREALRDARRRTLPDPGDIRGISRLPWELLEEQQDRQRLLAKLVVSLPDDEREQMAKFLPSVSRPELKRLMRQALKDILLPDAKRGLDPTESKILPMRIASLYISWVNCVSLNDRGILKKHVNKALADDGGFDAFADQLSARLKHYYTTLKPSSTTESSVPTEEESDQDLQLASTHTPHKKRKREVKESQEVKRNHESAQLRVALQEEQRKRLEWKMQSMGVGNNDPERQAVTFVNPIIYLDSHIGQRVKPHQLGGIQFMWRELIQDKMRQGCLLAHTMGLGKTMQVCVVYTPIMDACNEH